MLAENKQKDVQLSFLDVIENYKYYELPKNVKKDINQGVWSENIRQPLSLNGKFLQNSILKSPVIKNKYSNKPVTVKLYKNSELPSSSKVIKCDPKWNFRNNFFFSPTKNPNDQEENQFNEHSKPKNSISQNGNMNNHIFRHLVRWSDKIPLFIILSDFNFDFSDKLRSNLYSIYDENYENKDIKTSYEKRVRAVYEELAKTHALTFPSPYSKFFCVKKSDVLPSFDNLLKISRTVYQELSNWENKLYYDYLPNFDSSDACISLNQSNNNDDDNCRDLYNNQNFSNIQLPKSFMWEYLDLTNTPRGPFSSNQMRLWFDRRYFSPNLLLRMYGYGSYYLFCDLYPPFENSMIKHFIDSPIQYIDFLNSQECTSITSNISGNNEHKNIDIGNEKIELELENDQKNQSEKKNENNLSSKKLEDQVVQTIGSIIPINGPDKEDTEIGKKDDLTKSKNDGKKSEINVDEKLIKIISSFVGSDNLGQKEPKSIKSVPKKTKIENSLSKQIKNIDNLDDSKIIFSNNDKNSKIDILTKTQTKFPKNKKIENYLNSDLQNKNLSKTEIEKRKIIQNIEYPIAHVQTKDDNIDFNINSSIITKETKEVQSVKKWTKKIEKHEESNIGPSIEESIKLNYMKPKIEPERKIIPIKKNWSNICRVYKNSDGSHIVVNNSKVDSNIKSCNPSDFQNLNKDVEDSSNKTLNYKLEDVQNLCKAYKIDLSENFIKLLASLDDPSHIYEILRDYFPEQADELRRFSDDFLDLVIKPFEIVKKGISRRNRKKK